MKYKILLFVFGATLMGTANGQLLTHDDFQLNMGIESSIPISGESTGFGWGENWNIQGSEPGYLVSRNQVLTYPGLMSSKMNLTGGGTYRGSGRNLDNSLDGPYAAWLNDETRIGTNNTTLYLSFLAHNLNDQYRFGLSSGTSWAWSPKYFSVESQNDMFVLTINEVNYTTGIAFNKNETYLVVAKLDFNTESGNTVSLWINPTSLGNDAPAADFIVTETVATTMAFNSVNWYPGSGNDQGIIDEIRFGATFADVTPEAPPVVWFDFPATLPYTSAIIDHDALTITAEVPFAADATSLVPEIQLAPGFTSIPESGVATDFTNPVDYLLSDGQGTDLTYTTTITKALANTDNNLYSAQLLLGGKVTSVGEIDQDNQTVTFQIPQNTGTVYNLNYDVSVFALADIAHGAMIDLDNVTSLTVVAEDLTEQTYDFVVVKLEQEDAFRDDFTTDGFLSNWESRNWNNSGNSSIYQFEWIENIDNSDLSHLKVTKSSESNHWFRFTFPEALDLFQAGTHVRLRVSSAEPVTNFGLKLQDVFAPTSDGNFSVSTGNFSVSLSGDGNYVEYIQNYDEVLNSISPYLIKYLVFQADRTTSTVFSNIRIDDLRIGTDAYPNQAPTHDPVTSHPSANIADGTQSLVITGITDGNPERLENLSFTATSSNQEIVPDENIAVFWNEEAGEATVEYTPASNGNTQITVMITDDRGTIYSDEVDMKQLSFIAKFVSTEVGVNNPASFGFPVFTHVNVGTDNQHFVIIPDVDDGYIHDIQEIIFEYENLSTDRIIIDSLSYETGSKFALMYFRDLGAQGFATVKLSAIDEVALGEGEDPFEITFDIPLETYNTFGMNYGATQVAHWQPMPFGADPTFYPGYPVILPTASVVDDPSLDFFWGKSWGYIIPPETGIYRFTIEADPDTDGPFYLSTDASTGNLPAEANPTANKNSPSEFLTLEAGKAYYFEAYHKEIINTFEHRIKWVGPGIEDPTLIEPPYLFHFLDQELPQPPAEVNLMALGSEVAFVEWETGTDNIGIAGYMVYVNGNPFTQEPVAQTSMNLIGLSKETDYEVFVLSVDNSINYSPLSPVLSFTTYPEDNIPPTTPEGLQVTESTSFSISLEWDESTDGETVVLGYNLYINGDSEPVNPDPILGTTYKISPLDTETEYSVTVSAIDAALNESAPSAPVNISTNPFEWDNPAEDTYVGLVSFELENLAPSTGIGVEASFSLNSVFLSNKVGHNSFEDPRFVNNVTNEVLQTMNMEKSNGTVFRVETADPYDGLKSARVQVANGEWIRSGASIVMDPSFNYRFSFAMKAESDYLGEAVDFRIFRDVGGTVVAHSGTVTPTSAWNEYVFEFPGIQDALRSWKIEFSFKKLGTVVIDDVQLHIKERYVPGSKFTSVGMEILEELKPAGLRWGAIDANYESFSGSVGPFQQLHLTFGDIAYLSSLHGDYAFLTLGVNSETDWINNTNTFSHMIEYLNAPAGTTWGDVRIAEGYDQPFSETLNGIIMEMGNEVWGYASHGADAFGSNYANYSQWAAEVIEEKMKSSSYFDEDKMWVSLSGRSPDENYGLHNSLFTNENGQMDMLSISGYLGGNLNYDPAIPVGQSQLDYHKNSYAQMSGKINGLKAIFYEMLQRGMNRIVPQYMYEGNLTRNEYNGTAGQAVTFLDYYLTAMETGVGLTSAFALEGGQWRLLENPVTLAKRPLYHQIRLFNNIAKGGEILPTSFQTIRNIYNDNGIEVNMPSMGVHAYHNDGEYAVVLLSRDFENDYIIQLDLPDEVGTPANGKMVTITSTSFNSLDVIVSEEAMDISDGMLVTVPKFSSVFISFDGNVQDLPEKPIGNFDYAMATTFEVGTVDDKRIFDGPDDEIFVTIDFIPEELFYDRWDFEFVENPSNLLFTRANRRIYANASTVNGTAILRFVTLDGSNLSAEIEIEVTNMDVAVDEITFNGGFIYPNPAKEKLHIMLNEQAQSGRYEIINIQGSKVLEGNLEGAEILLDISSLKEGIFFIRIFNKDQLFTHRFIKK